MFSWFFDKHDRFFLKIFPIVNILKDLTEANGFINLIKSNTCFKGKGSCIDVILTNRKCSFKHGNSLEIGTSDHHHHLIYTMLQNTFFKVQPKLVRYGSYKTFNFESKVFLGNTLESCLANYDYFNKILHPHWINTHACAYCIQIWPTRVDYRKLSLLNYVPSTPSSLTCLRALRAFAPNVPSCLTYFRALRALIFTCLNYALLNAINFLIKDNSRMF